MPIKIYNLASLPESQQKELIPKIADLFKKEWDEFRFSKQDEQAWQKDVLASMGTIDSAERLPFRLVAIDESNGDFVGTVGAAKISSIQNNKEEWEPNEGIDAGNLSWGPWLRSLAVMPAYRQQGYGALLVYNLAVQLRNLGFTEELYLYHQPDVGRFYEALGMPSIGKARKKQVSEKHIIPEVRRGTIDNIIEKAQKIYKKKEIVREQMAEAESKLYHTSHSGLGRETGSEKEKQKQAQP